MMFLSVQNACELFTSTIFFIYVVNVLIAPARQVDQDGAVFMLLGIADSIGNGVRAFDGGNNPLCSAEEEEGLHGFLVGNNVVVHPAALPKISVFRADAGV